MRDATIEEIDSQLLQQVLADPERAFVNFFAHRVRYPHFKSRKRDRACFRIPQRVPVVGGRVQVPKVGRVRLRLSRPVEGQTKSATFTQDACGHWHVSLVATMQRPCFVLALPDPGRTVGLDLGSRMLLSPVTAHVSPPALLSAWETQTAACPTHLHQK